MTPASGSKTSPVPVRTSDTSLSATIIIASSRRRYRSVRQSLASSTAARVNCPGYCSSLLSSRSKGGKASAVAPAKPPITSPLPSLRTFLALDLITVWPIETWPSPPITTLPPLRTVKMVVTCQTGDSWGEACIGIPRVQSDLGVARPGYNRQPSRGESVTKGGSSALRGPYRSSEGGIGLLKEPRFLAHDPEKWVPVFRKDHAQTWGPESDFSCATPRSSARPRKPISR